MQEIEFSDESFGCKAILRAAVTPAMLSQLKGRAVEGLELNVSKGWSGDLGFVSELTSLKRLELMQLGGGEIDLSPIQKLSELTHLSLSTYSKAVFDFTAFPKLVDCSLEWQNGFSSIFEAKNLKQLFLNVYSETSSSRFSELKELEWLSLKGSAIEDLSGISELHELRHLEIGLSKNLKSLSGVERLSQLQSLELNACKNISSIEPVSSLKNLETLYVINCGDIESLKPIEGLSKLKKIMFYESTNIVDGDLSPLTGLTPPLEVSFQDRKHYTHKREEFARV